MSMLFTEILSMTEGETFTYHTDEDGSVFLSDVTYAIPSGYQDQGLRFTDSAESVVRTLENAPLGSYTAVKCQGIVSYNTQTFTTRQ